MFSVFARFSSKIGIASLLLGTALPGWTQKPVRVLVIGCDGFGGYAFAKAKAPNIRRLAEEGCHTYQARAVIPTMSSPNWASMINGTVPPQHKIWSNRWEPADMAKKSFCGNPEGQIFPTIFRLAREQRPDINMACVHEWDGFARLTEKETFSTRISAKNDDETVQEAVTLIRGNTPDFLFLDIDLLDHVGHQIGHDTPEYYTAVEKLDSLVGALCDALKAKGLYDETCILLTSDHGGRLKTHGGLTRREIEIPWIIRGPGIKKGGVPTETVHQYNTAPTLARLLGITPPACWKGRPVESIFDK